MISYRIDRLKESILRKQIYQYGTRTEKALANAVGDTTKKLRTIASKMMRDILAKGVPKKRVDNGIKRSLLSNLSGKISVKNTPHISLKHFKPKQTEEGVIYKPRKSGGEVFIKSAFGPKIEKLHRSVYVRTGRKKIPLTIQKYHSLADEFRDANIITEVNKQAEELLKYFVKRRMRELKLRLEGTIK